MTIIPKRPWMKEARARKHLSQSEAARRLMIHPCYYQMIENGTRTPSEELSKKLAELLDEPAERFRSDT